MNRKRMHSRSNQALQRLISAMGSTHCPSASHTHTSIHHIINHQLHEEELYKESYRMIQRIKSILVQSSSQQLMEELNDVIDLIKGQRAKAKFTIQELCALAARAEEQGNRVKDMGVNTDDMIVGELVESIDACWQTEGEQIKQKQKQAQLKQEQLKQGQKQANSRKYESYYKIVCMIDNLKVDYRQILPILPKLPAKYVLPDVDSKKDTYKVLRSEEIVKLQRVFITKIKSMVTNQQTKRKKSETISLSGLQTPKKSSGLLNSEPQTASSLADEDKPAGRQHY